MYDQKKVDEFILRSENIIESRNSDEAFLIISSEIDECENRYLNEFITVLNLIRHEKTLDWIENSAHRITNVGSNWGHLAASSYFSWGKADEWLTKGRPYSLIALDALAFCTTIGERSNQSPWMREIQPKLIGSPGPDKVAGRLQEYLQIDSTPRTKTVVNHIVANIFDPGSDL